MTKGNDSLSSALQVTLISKCVCYIYHQAQELILWQAPPTHTAKLAGSFWVVTPHSVICLNGGLTCFLWSCRTFSTAARSTGSQPQCANACLGGALEHVCVCVRLCWVEVQQGKGSLVSQFSALIGVNEWPFCCSAESLHPSPSLSSQHGGKMTHSHSSRHDIITGLMPVYEPGHTLMYTFSLKRDVFHKHRAEQ